MKKSGRPSQVIGTMGSSGNLLRTAAARPAKVVVHRATKTTRSRITKSSGLARKPEAA